jgi:transaldolase/glucose-6-phosphate isomerase
VRRLCARDASLWTGSDEGRWLGWLGVTDDQLAHIERLQRISQAARSAGFEHALLLGMGGSSLGPEVMRMTFGKIAGYPQLHVLDSTDPDQIRSCEKIVNHGRTLYIVSSKSGGTLEPMIFEQYFFERLKQHVGEGEAGNRFIAITDPGSKLQGLAQSEGFRRIFSGDPHIGGRYSVLSDFGLVPAAIMGVDVPKLLDRTEEMVHACMPSVPIEENVGVMLGLILGLAHNQGRDKLTLITSPGVGDLGAWLEQLVGESTGKAGIGIIPVDRESLGAPGTYGDDRLFVYVRLNSAPDPTQDLGVEALVRAGHPVVRIGMKDVYDLGAEFFRWEIATAVAGAVIGIHPFDQPDVEASKVATHRLTAEFERTGKLPPESALLEGRLKLFADEHNATALRAAARSSSMADYLRAHLDRIHTHDYFAVLGFIEMNSAHEEILQRIRHLVRDQKKVATCLGFGPRFLHSTGQAYKGGPNSGVFLQVTADSAADVPVPGHRFTFGVVKAAQARGDFQVLVARRRRVLRIDLGADATAGLGELEAAVRQALASSEDRSSRYAH